MKFIKALLATLTGFRKFIMGITFLVVTLVLLFLDRVTGTEFINTNRDMVVAFMATNIGEHIVNVVKDHIKGKSNEA